MSAITPLRYLIGIYSDKLSKEENIYLEAELFVCVYELIKDFFKTEYRNYFDLMKYSTEMESAMLEANFIRLMIKDILATDEYTLSGIAYYTETPEEIICEILTSANPRPSATFLRKIIELHRQVKRDLYQEIKRKILTEHLTAA